MLEQSTTTVSTLQDLSHQELLDETRRLAASQRGALARLVAAIGEVDARRLFLGEGCSSMFVYCTRILLLSEHAAYMRIEAARLARRFPVILERLADGSLTLTNICLLAPHLTVDNCDELIAEAMHKSKRELEELLAARFGRDDAPRNAALFVHPLGPDRFRVEFVVSRETLDKLRQAQDLLCHTVPDRDPAVVFDKALTLLLDAIMRDKVETRGCPKATRVTPSRGRYIPAAVKRAVWKRDNGECAFVGVQGRCRERRFLEFHHLRPFAAGGPTTVENLQLRCRAHNAYEAEVFFGPAKPWLGEKSATPVVETRSGESDLGQSDRRVTTSASAAGTAAAPPVLSATAASADLPSP